MAQDSSASHPEPESKNWRRAILPIVILVLVIGIAGLYLRAPRLDLTRSSTDVEGSLEVHFIDVEVITHTGVVDIRGKANQPSQIDLYVNGKLVGRMQTDEMSRWRSPDNIKYENSFLFRDVLLHPGKNSLLAEAKSIVPRGPLYPVQVEQETEWIADENAKPRLLRLPQRVTSQPLTLQGTAYPGSTVRCKAFGFNASTRQPSAEVPGEVVVNANAEGYFQASQPLPGPGKFTVDCGYEAVQNAPEWYRTLVDYDPLAARRIDIEISYDEIAVATETTLSKDVEEVADLISGRKPLPEFIEQYGLYVGDFPIAFEFTDVTPIIAIDDKKATIRARAVSSRSYKLPIRHGTLELARGSEGGYPLDTPQDSLSVRVVDYEVKAYGPAPTKIESDVAFWSGSRDPLDQSRDVKLLLTYNPFRSPRTLLQLLALNPHEIVGANISSFFSIVFALLYAVPIVWLIGLLDKHSPIPWLSWRYAKKLTRIGLWLLGLIFAPAILRLSDGLFGWAYEKGWVRFLDEIKGGRNRPLQLLASNLFVWLVLSLSLLFPRFLFRRRRTVVVVLKTLFGGLNRALLIRLVLGAIYFGLSLFSRTSSESNIASTLIALVVLLLLLAAIKRLASSNGVTWLRWRWWYWLVLFLILVGLAYPGGKNIFALGNYRFPVWQVTYSNVELLLSLLQDILPFVWLIGILQILKRCDRQEPENLPTVLSLSQEAEVHPLILSLSLLLFSCYVVGTTANWFIIPIPFILALILYPRLVALPYSKVRAMQSLTNFVHERRSWIFKKVFELAAAHRIINSLDQLEKKISSGDLTVEDFNSRKANLESYAERLKNETIVSADIDAKDLALSIGPHATNWANAIHAVRWGLIISLPFLLLFIFTYLLKQIRPESTFVPLSVLIRIGTFVLDWAASAFFFGYFFNHLRGESGVKKGLNVALVVIICFAPVWLMSGLSSVELSATFLRAGQIFLFFTVLGVWAFDYFTFRRSLKEEFSWRRFARFGDIASFTAVASVIVTSVGVAVTSVISGQFVSLISHLVTSIFPELPTPTKK